jgi:hypothetical protein
MRVGGWVVPVPNVRVRVKVVATGGRPRGAGSESTRRGRIFWSDRGLIFYFYFYSVFRRIYFSCRAPVLGRFLGSQRQIFTLDRQTILWS